MGDKLDVLLTNPVRDVIFKELRQTLVRYSNLRDVMGRAPKGAIFTRAEIGFMELYDTLLKLLEVMESGRI